MVDLIGPDKTAKLKLQTSDLPFFDPHPRPDWHYHIE